MVTFLDKTSPGNHGNLLLCLSIFICATFAIPASGQVDDICREFGYIATLEAPRLTAPFVYGRISVSSTGEQSKAPTVSVTFQSRGATPERQTVGRSGNYCFRVTGGAGGTLIVELDGVEMARRQLATFGPAQQREDFDISADNNPRSSSPSVVSGKFYRPPNKKTSDLYKKAAEAEEKGDLGTAEKHLRSIVKIDAQDYIAWGLLGAVQFERDSLDDAEASIRSSITFRDDYTPAWLTAAQIRTKRKQYEAAIEVLKHVVSLEPAGARGFQLLGEAYLYTKQGTLGAEALNKALELDPVGMAECHLQLAHLYQLAKANQMAADEYKKFLEKVPDHPERKKFEKFIKDNS